MKKTSILALFIGVMSTIAQGVQVDLVLQDGEQPTRLDLPFAYKQLPRKGYEDIKYLPESFYTILKKGERAFVGPLNPCSLIALGQAGKDPVVMHKHQLANKIEEVITLLESKFDATDGLEGTIFTTYNPNVDENFKKERAELIGQESVDHDKDAIIKKFGIKDANKIKGIAFKNTYENLGEYGWATTCVLVENNDGNLTISNISPVQENIFFDNYQYSLSTRYTILNSRLNLETVALFQKYATQQDKDFASKHRRLPLIERP